MTTRLMPLMLVAVVLACGSGCAKPDWIQQTLVTVDVTGTWVGTIGRGGATPADVRLEMEHDGPVPHPVSWTTLSEDRTAIVGVDPLGP